MCHDACSRTIEKRLLETFVDGRPPFFSKFHSCTVAWFVVRGGSDEQAVDDRRNECVQ